MASLRQRIVEYISERPGIRFTNADLAHALGAPIPSVRRATLNAMFRAQINDGGPSSYNPSVVTYVAIEVE